MRGVDLDRLEPGGHRAPCGVTEAVHDPVDLVHAQRARRLQIAERQVGRTHGAPTAFVGRHGLPIVSDCEAAGRAFASGVVELDRGHGAGLFDAVGDPPVRVDLPVFPQTQVARRDAPVRRDRGRFDDDEAEPAHRTGDIVLVVEGGGPAVARERRIHVHRRQPYAVACGHATQRDRGKQRRLRCRGRWLHRFGFLGFLGFLGVLGMWLCFAHTPPPYHTTYGGGGAPAWMRRHLNHCWQGS